MHSKKILSILICLMLVSVTAGAQTVTQSTVDDQQAVEVTVYNSNIALIKDQREIALPSGKGELRFMDVAAQIRPETVYVECLNHPNDFMVLEQNYEYDLMDYNKLLDKYIGKKLKIENYNAYQDTTKMVDAVLLSNNSNQPVYKIGDEIYLGYNGIRILPEIPENLISKPTLMWLYDYAGRDKAKIEISYLTSGMHWKADYILVLNRDDTQGSLAGWVTVDNKSGTLYKKATLKLVAGDVNVVQRPPMAKRAMVFAEGMDANGAAQFEEKGFFEYHIYDLQRPTSLKNNQIKQISLLEANGITVEKEYLVYGQSYYFTRQYREDNPKQPVNVYVKFQNDKENKMGMPLPKGTMRLYKQDEDKKLQFIGEDSIEHTPKDEEVSLKVGEAFDVTAERKQTDFRQLSTRLYETEWEITLKNHKEEDVVIGVIEPVTGNWQVVNSSHTFIKEDAFTLRFDVPVAKDEEVKVVYRLRVGLR